MPCNFTDLGCALPLLLLPALAQVERSLLELSKASTGSAGSFGVRSESFQAGAAGVAASA